MAVRITQRAHRKVVKGQFLLGIILVCVTVLVSVSMLRRPISQPKVETAAPIVGSFDVISVPVPSEYVPAGKRVRDIKLRNVNFPTHQVPQGALISIDSIRDATTVVPLPANLPLFPENFSDSAVVQNPVVERIPPGMRAMTIRVDATAAVEGWAGSGSIVDVLLIEKDRTTVVAEKIKVLSAERSVAPVEGAAAPNVPTTVTLLVTQDQCLAINTAIPRGKIAFALRSTKDDDNWESPTFTAEKLKGVTTVAERRSVVTGYVEIKDAEKGAGTKSFALADGKWTKTQAVPEGFLVNKEKIDG